MTSQVDVVGVMSSMADKVTNTNQGISHISDCRSVSKSGKQGGVKYINILKTSHMYGPYFSFGMRCVAPDVFGSGQATGITLHSVGRCGRMTHGESNRK